jgi:hypothetical protein
VAMPESIRATIAACSAGDNFAPAENAVLPLAAGGGSVCSGGDREVSSCTNLRAVGRAVFLFNLVRGSSRKIRFT